MTPLQRTDLPSSRRDRVVSMVKIVVSITMVGIAAKLSAKLPLTDGLWSSNLHAGLALYLFEVIVAACSLRVRTSAPPLPVAGSKTGRLPQTATDISEIVWGTVTRVMQNLAWRCPTLVLGTLVGVAWCGEHAAVHTAALLPTVVGLVAQRSLVKTVAQIAIDHLRGPLLQNQQQANERAAYLRSRAGFTEVIEPAQKGRSCS